MRDKRFWNPSLPQTLQGAAFLLYANTIFALLFRTTGSEGTVTLAIAGLLRSPSGFETAIDASNVIRLVIVAGSAIAGFLVVNEKKVGWVIGVVVALIPMIAGALALSIGYPVRPKLFTVIDIGFLFDAALVGCLFHSQTTDYRRIWFK